MSTFAKVLLATDLTPQADKLTECLFSLCPDTETEVVLAHVFDDDDDADPDGSSFKKARSRLEGYQSDLEQAGYEEISIETPVGDTCEVLESIAEQQDAELLMVASHNKGFFERALRGSTTLELARNAALPLFIYKGDEDTSHESRLLSAVMVPTDFSKKSLEALNVIRTWREEVGKVVFFHVVERVRNKKDYKEKYSNAMLLLKELVDEMNIFGIKADFRIARGVASKQIGKIVGKENISMIMMAKSGSDVNSGLTLGSTSENVVLNAECPVLLLPAEEDDD